MSPLPTAFALLKNFLSINVYAGGMYFEMPAELKNPFACVDHAINTISHQVISCHDPYDDDTVHTSGDAAIKQTSDDLELTIARLYRFSKLKYPDVINILAFSLCSLAWRT